MPSLNDSLADILKEAEKIIDTPISGEDLDESVRQLEGQSAALKALEGRIQGTSLEKPFAEYVGGLWSQEQKTLEILRVIRSNLAIARMVCAHSNGGSTCRICGADTFY